MTKASKARAATPDPLTGTEGVYDHDVDKDTGQRAVEGAYEPEPYEADADETLECPSCDRMNDTDAKYCDQCGYGDLDTTSQYSQKPDENIKCPQCQLMNDTDAEYCDQCGIKLEGRTDVTIVGHSEPGVSGLNSSEPPADTPTRNLIRANGRGSAEFRAADETADDDFLGVLYGNFSQFNNWYEVSSLWEGNFLERCMPGCFADTIQQDRANMRVLYDHGMDPTFGNKPLGPIRTLEERADGAYYEVDLLDTDYNRNQMVPMLSGKLINGEYAGSQLGASFRFAVQDDRWNYPTQPAPHNPNMLPERSIYRTQVFEFGPVTFPANVQASAAMRSASDLFAGRLVGSDTARAQFEQRVGRKVAERVIAGIPAQLRSQLAKVVIDEGVAARRRALQRRARVLVDTAR